MTNKFWEELEKMRPDDKVQMSQLCHGYEFLATAGHGYLVVPVDHANSEVAKHNASGFSYRGKLAYYLEEDSDAGDFLKELEFIKNRELNNIK